jgi:hypothetical protein
MNLWMNEFVNEWICEWMNLLMNEFMTEWIYDSMNLLLNEFMNEWTKAAWIFQTDKFKHLIFQIFKFLLKIMEPLFRNLPSEKMK